MRYFKTALEVKSSNASGAIFDCSSFREKTIWIYEATAQSITATITIEGSLDGGTTWLSEKVFTNAGGGYEFTKAYEKIRVTTSGWSAGVLRGMFASWDMNTSA